MAVSKKDLQCTIGKNIRDARKTCGYTKEVLAEKAEISVEHIYIGIFVQRASMCSQELFTAHVGISRNV